MAYFVEYSSAEAEILAFHVGIYSMTNLFLLYKVSCIDEYYFKDSSIDKIPLMQKWNLRKVISETIYLWASL